MGEKQHGRTCRGSSRWKREQNSPGLWDGRDPPAVSVLGFTLRMSILHPKPEGCGNVLNILPRSHGPWDPHSGSFFFLGKVQRGKLRLEMLWRWILTTSCSVVLPALPRIPCPASSPVEQHSPWKHPLLASQKAALPPIPTTPCFKPCCDSSPADQRQQLFAVAGASNISVCPTVAKAKAMNMPPGFSTLLPSKCKACVQCLHQGYVRSPFATVHVLPARPREQLDPGDPSGQAEL